MTISPDAYITMLVHGDSKVGKTFLGSTAPGPVLFLDAEAGGMRFVPGRKVVWDPMKEDPPAMEDHDICQVIINSTVALDTVVSYIKKGGTPFASVVLDSVTEYQSRLKREISATGDLEQRDWGKILIKIEDMIMTLRDCVERQPQLQCFIVIAGTQFRDGKSRPMLQGAMKDKLSYKLDATAFLYTMKDDQGNNRRGLRILGDGRVDAGNRFPGEWPDVVWDPNIVNIIQKMSDNIESMNSNGTS